MDYTVGRMRVEEGLRGEGVEMGGKGCWRGVVGLSGRWRARLGFWAALVGLGEVAGTTGRALSTSLALRSLWACGQAEGLLRADAGLWLCAWLFAALAALLRQPFRGSRMACPAVVYCLLLAQLGLGLGSAALWAWALGTSHSLARSLHEQCLERDGGLALQRELRCCSLPDSGLKDVPPDALCPEGHCSDTGRNFTWLPYSCCAEQWSECGQCPALWPPTWQQRLPPPCAPRLQQLLASLARRNMVLSLILPLLNLFQLMCYRLGETSAWLALRLGRGAGSSAGWLFGSVPPLALLRAALERAGRPRARAGGSKSAELPPEGQRLSDELHQGLLDLADGSSDSSTQRRRAERELAEWNDRWHSLLLDGVEECETDYEDQARRPSQPPASDPAEARSPANPLSKAPRSGQVSSRRPLHSSRTFRPSKGMGGRPSQTGLARLSGQKLVTAVSPSLPSLSRQPSTAVSGSLGSLPSPGLPRPASSARLPTALSSDILVELRPKAS